MAARRKGAALALCSLALVGVSDACSAPGTEHSAQRRDPAAWSRDVAHVTGQARAYLDQRLGQGVREPAIVLDVDDTSLATHQFVTGPDSGVSEAEQAAAEARLPAIAPMRDLARYAARRGVGVFFVTGRTDEPGLRRATLVNLRDQGFPEPAGLIMRPAADHGRSVVPYKSGARAGLERRGYRVLESIGDQRSDLDGGHAERGFKLPNATYTVP